MSQVRTRKRKVVEKDGFPITSESITLKDFMTQWLNEVICLAN